MSNHVQCPLCEEGRMFLTELDSANNILEGKSYMWICEQCPGILLEWYGKEDTAAFATYLNGDRRHVLKEYGPPEEQTNANMKDILDKEG